MMMYYARRVWCDDPTEAGCTSRLTSRVSESVYRIRTETNICNSLYYVPADDCCFDRLSTLVDRERRCRMLANSLCDYVEE